VAKIVVKTEISVSDDEVERAPTVATLQAHLASLSEHVGVKCPPCAMEIVRRRVAKDTAKITPIDGLPGAAVVSAAKAAE